MVDAPLEWFGQYVILEPLGHGGMGRVDLAMNVEAGKERLVVLKRLLADGDADAAAALREEAKLTSRFRHPNLVSALGTEQTATELAMVMEYVEGHALVHLTRRHAKLGTTAPVAVSIRIVSDVLLALEWAHGLHDENGDTLRLIHRDVTPHNVLLTYAGAAKVLDFGLAKVANVDSRTAAGLVKGKVGYMAPEQVRGEAIDARIDVFATGVILWELLTSRRLFRDAGANWDFAAHGARPLPTACGFSDVDDRLAALVARAVAWSPDDRFATAAEFRHALDEYVSEYGRACTPSEVARHLASVLGGVNDSRRERVLERYAFVRSALRDGSSRTTILPTSEKLSEAPVVMSPGAGRSPTRSWMQTWSLAVGAGLCALAAALTSAAPRLAGVAPQGSSSRARVEKRLIEQRFEALRLSATQSKSAKATGGDDDVEK